MLAAVVGQSWATLPHPFSLEVNGTDRVDAVRWGSVSVTMPGPGSNGAMAFTLTDPGNLITLNEWDEVRWIEHAATRPIQFGGFVQSVRYLGWRRGLVGRDIAVTCVGYGILLDKKVVTSFLLGDDAGGDVSVGGACVSLVNRFGGRVAALSIGYADLTRQTDATYGVVSLGNEWNWILFSGTAYPVPLPAPMKLRAAVDYILALGSGFDASGNVIPVAGVYWVDSACRLVMLYDAPPGGMVTNAGTLHQQFADSYPGLALDGTTVKDSPQYERENTDRVTSAYVQGGSPAGSGFYRGAPLDRAGDLEEIVSDSSALAAGDVAAKGGSIVARTIPSIAKGVVQVESQTPLDVWPGRQVTVDVANANVSAAQEWRMTSVTITYPTSTDRVYTIGYGGSIARPSMARRQGGSRRLGLTTANTF